MPSITETALLYSTSKYSDDHWLKIPRGEEQLGRRMKIPRGEARLGRSGPGSAGFEGRAIVNTAQLSSGRSKDYFFFSHDFVKSIITHESGVVELLLWRLWPGIPDNVTEPTDCAICA